MPSNLGDCNPQCSIVLSTRNKAMELNLSLASIRKQSPPFAYELIVVDDGSRDSTKDVCRYYDTDKYIIHEKEIVHFLSYFAPFFLVSYLIF